MPSSCIDNKADLESQLTFPFKQGEYELKVYRVELITPSESNAEPVWIRSINIAVHLQGGLEQM